MLRQLEAASMGKKKAKRNYRRSVLRLPDLDHSKLAVLNCLTSPRSRRVYQYSIEQFIAWYCSEPRLAFSRIVVVRYRMHLESRGLAATWFVLAALVFMVVGRMLGWWVSRVFLYSAPRFLAFLGATAWGIAVGFAMSGLIGWLHPGTALRWVLGFALGGYVAVPNYGLFSEATIPAEDMDRHRVISICPLLAYM